MIKKRYRFFGNRSARQQKSLNAMSHKGYRLIGTGKISYEFERCRPDEYRYCVESVTHLVRMKKHTATHRKRKDIKYFTKTSI